MIEQSQNILAEPVDLESAAGKRGCAMAVTVASQDSEMLRERWYLCVPHGKIRAQRIRQHQHRQFLLAVETIVKLGAFHRCKWHISLALRFLEADRSHEIVTQRNWERHASPQLAEYVKNLPISAVQVCDT